MPSRVERVRLHRVLQVWKASTIQWRCDLLCTAFPLSSTTQIQIFGKALYNFKNTKVYRNLLWGHNMNNIIFIMIALGILFDFFLARKQPRNLLSFVLLGHNRLIYKFIKHFGQRREYVLKERVPEMFFSKDNWKWWVKIMSFLKIWQLLKAYCSLPPFPANLLPAANTCS